MFKVKTWPLYYLFRVHGWPHVLGLFLGLENMKNKKYKLDNYYFKHIGGRIKFSGKCMEPQLKENFKVEVNPMPIDKVKIGDIIVFGQDLFTCHRVIGKANLLGKIYLIQKGDNNFFGGVAESKNFIGRVSKILDDKGNEVDILQRNDNFDSANRLLIYAYLILYLIKRIILRDKKNRFTGFVHRLFWKLFPVH
jgi:signal peptidase I